MSRAYTFLKRRLARLGRGGGIGLGLFALCLTVYLSALRPAQVRLDQLHDNMTALREKKQGSGNSVQTRQNSLAEQLLTYYNFFPPQMSTPFWLDKIYKAALEQNIELAQGEYRANREKAGKLVHYQITMPVKGNYLQLRKFLAAVLTEIPVASLDQISFERQKIGEEVIEAKIRLTLYLGQEG